jgi:hypothetical protein
VAPRPPRARAPPRARRAGPRLDRVPGQLLPGAAGRVPAAKLRGRAVQDPELVDAPTLEVGDFILVNKFAYGVRLPIVEQKVVETGDRSAATSSCSATR